VKANQKAAKRPNTLRYYRKKRRSKIGAGHALLIAVLLICAALLATGGFFAVRSTLSGVKKSGVFLPDAGQGTSQKDLLKPPPEIQTLLDNPQNKDATDAADAIEPDGRKGLLALVIDDVGNNLRDLDPFLKFPGQITISVMPGLPNSVEAAKRVRAAGKELFLHQPMEPINSRNLDRDVIKTGMTPAEIKGILIENLNEIGPVSGINNHEGSRATMDAAIMRPVLEISRDRNIVFLDSKTINGTVTLRVARELGIAAAERALFLDNEQDRASIMAALEAGRRLAERNGAAILIGHVWSKELAAILAEMYPEFVKQGFVFASASSVINRNK
jgi:polysaccharide deacetylase 2 family uncharacterized protein YibQ